MVTLDKIATRYHKLPTEILENASTFDLQVMDIGIRYEIVAEQKRNGTYVKPSPKMSTEDMQRMLDQAKK